MPSAAGNFDGLPEPADLHARLSREHPLDWGDPLPTTARIAAKYGDQATHLALSQLNNLDPKVEQATQDLVASTRPGSTMYQVHHRIKSPQSMARKLSDRLGATRKPPVLEDVLRYTVVADEPDRLVELARHLVSELQDRGWQLKSVRNSYVDGSRYKGLHLDTVDAGGRRVEVQLHTPASVAVKEATTRLYEVERDTRSPGVERDLARAECVRLSTALETPRGLDELASLGECRVEVRGYGLGRATDNTNRNARPQGPVKQPTPEHRKVTRDGMDR
jgi:hypothetical protein